MSCFDRRVAPAANAVRARNDGAKPRLTSANAPFFRKTRREMSSDLRSYRRLLKFRRPERQRESSAARVVAFGDRRARASRTASPHEQRRRAAGQRVRDRRRVDARAACSPASASAKFMRLTSAPVLTHASAVSL